MKVTTLYIFISILLIIIISLTTYIVRIKSETNIPAMQVQKFRFGEQCPDGLRVEYVSTIRLPKAVICQKAVGE